MNFKQANSLRITSICLTILFLGLMSASITHAEAIKVTQLEQINTSLNNGRPVLLEFGADWCGPCQEMKPILSDLATEYAGKASIMTVDVDVSPKLSDYFYINSIPDSSVIVGIENNNYIYMQEDGTKTQDRLKARIIGVQNKQKFEKVLNFALSNKSSVAAFTASPTSGSIPLKVQFTDQSTNNPTSWKWDFGDGTTSTTHNPLHTYIKAGKYTVVLTVKNTAGSNTVTKSNYIVVTALKPPVAAFKATPLSGKKPLTVSFTDKSTNNPTSWSWVFGDGSTSTAQNPKHKYTKAGTYSVKLTVKNAGGSNSLTKSKFITVK